MNDFSTSFKNQKDKNDFYIALVVIVLFLGGGLFGFNMFNKASLNEESSVTPDLNVEYKGFAFAQEDKEFMVNLLNNKSNIEQVDNWLENTPADTSLMQKGIAATDSIQSINLPIDTTTQRDTAATIPVENVDSLATTDTLTIDSTTIEIDSVSITDEAPEKEMLVEEPPKVVEKPKAKEKPQTTNTSGNCIIMVGSFTRGSNAESLKKELIQQGYPAFTFFRKSAKVVGIKQSCDDEAALQQTLKKIKVKYTNAWVLRKK